MLEEFLDAEPLYIPVSSQAGGIEAAMHALLVALGERLPSDPASEPQPEPEPLEELVLELSDLKYREQGGTRARLVYEPAIPGEERVHSAQSWRLTAPIGPIEAEDLRWYLEKYAIWRSDYFRDRDRQLEADLEN